MKLIIDVPKETFNCLKNMVKAECVDPYSLADIIVNKSEVIEELKPQGDLISREALKEATKSFVDCDGFNPIWQIIDNAPTVKAYTFEEVESIRNEALEFARNSYERPHGKWIPEHDWVHCFPCGHEQNYPSNYCPNCGADMRKGGAE